MENIKQKIIYELAREDLDKRGEVDYSSIRSTLGLDPHLASDGIHVRLMRDGTIMFINPEDDYLWEEVDRAIQDFEEVNSNVSK